VKTIGIHPQEGLFYEGDNNYGRGVLPAPTVLVATALSIPIDITQIPDTEDLGHIPLVFREDSFDAVTRLRRGRFYERGENAQPHQWHVQPHQALPTELARGDSKGQWAKLLHGFRAWPARLKLSTSVVPSIVALGPRGAFSLWRAIDVERVVTSEDLVTLKARGSMGILPELDTAAVPLDALPKVIEVLDSLVQSAHTSAPAAVVDRARDAAQWCLGVYLSAESGDTKKQLDDLSNLAKTLFERKSIASLAAQTIARLHSRGKPNEQARYEGRLLAEGDAEHALASVGLILREIGWAG
jgi:hypothetical protein